MEKRHTLLTNTKETRQIKHHITCDSTKLTYVTECKWCRKHYIGETRRTLHKRFEEHRQAKKNPLHAIATVVCYRVAFSAVAQRSSPQTAAVNRNHIPFWRFKPIGIQLQFPGRCSRHVCGTMTPPITALLLSVPHV